MEKKYPIGAVVGRFQIHDLHDAHRYIIDQVVDNHKKSIIFLGVPKVVGTKKNPLDFDSRKRMIQTHYPDSVIIALPDVGDDTIWAAELDRRVREIYPIGDVLLYGGRDSFIPYYKKGNGQFDCKELDQYTFVSGTEVRKEISETVKNSVDFRAGLIYQSYNQYPKVHPCIDVAITNEDNTMLLLAKKPKENGWRFVGGFAHPDDSCYETTLKRKIRDDVGPGIEIGDIKYLGSARIPDWRYRGEEDKILTILYKCKKLWGQIIPSDDVSELKFFNINELNDSIIVEEHKCLLKIFLEKYES
jgi:bifunctional NMN adenylyltransferase/nudix hydrolase